MDSEFWSTKSNSKSQNMFPSSSACKQHIPASPQAIFCCSSAAPVVTDSATKIHNDPNRDVHDSVFQSFMAYVFRAQHKAVLNALVQRYLPGLGLDDTLSTDEVVLPPLGLAALTSQTPPMSPGFQTVQQRVNALAETTPPFTPARLQKGYDYRTVHGESLRDSDVVTKDVDNTYSELTSLSARRAALLPSSNSSLTPSPAEYVDLVLPESAISTVVTSASITPDAIISAPTTTSPSDPASILKPSPLILSKGEVSTSTAQRNVLDHVMVIPEMPHPKYPTEELIKNPLSPETLYVIHLTSRHDYGPVYSHRYFVCPISLDDDWVEISLLQWFAQGEPFKMKAEKWDIKCETDSRFFRMTLRPNLNMRQIE